MLLTKFPDLDLPPVASPHVNLEGREYQNNAKWCRQSLIQIVTQLEIELYYNIEKISFFLLFTSNFLRNQKEN